MGRMATIKLIHYIIIYRYSEAKQKNQNWIANRGVFSSLEKTLRVRTFPIRFHSAKWKIVEVPERSPTIEQRVSFETRIDNPEFQIYNKYKWKIEN